MKNIYLVLLALSLSISSNLSFAKAVVYVSDQVEIPAREEGNSRSKIVKMLPSGEALELLESTESGWTKIKTNAGDIGWIGSRYLMNNKAARTQLEKISNQYNSQVIIYKQQTIQLKAIEKQLSEAQKQYKILLVDKSKITAKVEHIEQTYKNSLEIEHENQQLNSKILQLTGENKLLKSNSFVEQDRRARNSFIVGALVLLFGGILGFIIRALFASKKVSSGWR